MLKLAVPTRAGEVDEHFGHCESFTVYNIDDNKAVIGQERFTPPPSCGCKSNLIPTLVEMGVKVLVAGNMGEGAVQRLQQAGIQVFRGAKGDVAVAVQAWLDGTLKDSQLLCAAHGDGHECHHGEGH
jgi:predicted Fe-Mo cluster-binding NifX family protein